MAISRIYLKLITYYVIMIGTCCVATAALFFLTAGYPLVKDAHSLARKQVLYLAELTTQNMQRGPAELEGFLEISARSYESGLLVFGPDLRLIAQAAGPEELNGIRITPEMLAQIRAKGIYRRISHLGKPIIYVLPLETGTGPPHYLMFYKSFDTLRQALMLFSVGLVILCVLLIAGIYPLARGFIHPLTQLTKALKRVSAGNFEVNLDVRKRNDELGELLEVFLEMAASVDRMLAARKELLADISHELRSPLGRLSAAAELIRGSCTSTPEVAGYLASIEYEIGFMDNMLRQLAQYSALNLPSLCLQLEDLSARELLDEAYARYRPLMGKHGIKFMFQGPAKTPLVRVDRARIMQVFANLLDNALHATDTGGGISLGLAVAAGEAVFTVANTGPEIPLALREKIFEPLFRTDPSRNRKTGGLGLGLAIAKKTVELHGGRIECTCAGGVTRFSFYLKTMG